MSRSERFSTPHEIRRRFPRSTDPGCGAGTVVWYENGTRYCDDGESHIAVIGRTGMGKTQGCSLPFTREVIEHGESLIVQDPKGELYRRSACFLRGRQQVFCIDLRKPHLSPTKWNPLEMPYRLYHSDDPLDRDFAGDLVSELFAGVYVASDHEDKFWPNSAANYAKGLTYTLFEYAEHDEVNLDSVAAMMYESEHGLAGSNLVKNLYEVLPQDSLAKRNIATYATAPSETRASIHSVATQAIEIFARNKGLMEMLAQDTLDILHLDVTRPFAIFVITPDENSVYDALSGLLISQVTQHLIRVAQSMRGRLPIRCNIILEELGSVGRSIPSLPDLMVAGRSRNIRLMLLLQSYAQLRDIYGESLAETISSCIGITFGFSTNNWNTLEEWSKRLGQRTCELNGHIYTEPLITATQLAAMPVCTCLVTVESRYRYIAHMPLYDEMYDNSGWTEPDIPAVVSPPNKIVNFRDLVGKLREQHLESLLRGRLRPSEPTPAPSSAPSRPPMPPRLPDHTEMIRRLEQQINARIVQLEEEERAKNAEGGRRSKNDAKPETVSIVITELNRRSLDRAIELISEAQDVSCARVEEQLRTLPATLKMPSREEAERLAGSLRRMGNTVRIES